jgi:hypothetical protein
MEVEFMTYKITWKTYAACLFLALLFDILLGETAVNIIENFAMRDFMKFPSSFSIINLMFWSVALMIPISIVHEWIHGTVFIIFGGKVKYGFKGVYAYTREVSGKPIFKEEFIFVLLMPTIVISLLCLLLPFWLGGMVFLLNLLGASGDIYFTLLLLRYRKESKIIDRGYGFDVV